MRRRILLAQFVILMIAGLCTAVLAQPRLFLDLSRAQAFNDTPTPHSPSEPVTTLEVAPGELVRVTVGYQFAGGGSVTRWYLLSAYLSVVHPHLSVQTPDRLQPENNAFWHSDVTSRALNSAVKVAVSPDTAPMRANLMKPLDGAHDTFCDSGALWVVMAPGGSSQTGAFFVGHVYLRVSADAPDGTQIPLRLSSEDDPLWIKPNTLVATDSPRRYHLIGNDLPPAQVTLVVRRNTTLLRTRVILGDFTGDASTRTAQVQIRPVGQTTPLRTYQRSPDENGVIELPVDLQGAYDVAVKANHWLRRVVSSVNLSGEVNLTVSLINGDVDGDNEVTLFDFGSLVAAFGTMQGDTGWNADADLDGDEEVTLFDFGILVRNFGEIGDE